MTTLENVKTVVSKLRKQEHTYGENREEISDEIVSYIADRSTDELQVLRECIVDILQDRFYLDEDDVIIRAREKTVNEVQLYQDGVIFDAEQAEEMSDRARKEEEDLKFSGLSETKTEIFQNIRESIKRAGKWVNVYGWRYREPKSLISWLKTLNFSAEPIGHNEGLAISWKFNTNSF